MTPTLVDSGENSFAILDTYEYTSDYVEGVTFMRVMRPKQVTDLIGAHRYVYLLPVEPRTDWEDATPYTFGDPISYMSGGLAAAFNATCIMPEFPEQPWVGDNPLVPGVRYESFYHLDLRPWIEANVAGGGEHHLISFSKGGLGAFRLILARPDLWDRAAIWESPMTIDSTYVNYDADSWDMDVIYGPANNGNFDTNYRGIVLANDETLIQHFRTQPRLWFNQDETDTGYHLEVNEVLEALIDNEVAFALGGAAPVGIHNWFGASQGGSSNWLEYALAGLSAMQFTEGSGVTPGASSHTGSRVSRGIILP